MRKVLQLTEHVESGLGSFMPEIFHRKLPHTWVDQLNLIMIQLRQYLSIISATSWRR